MSHLTIAYFTSRKEPKLEWFFGSLYRQLAAAPIDIGLRIVVVDIWLQAMDDWTQEMVDARRAKWTELSASLGADVVLTAPKPCVWQGPGRLTKENWFAASNARNTAICLAPGDWIAFVDDVSVLQPGWLPAVRRAMDTDGYTITLGAYRKVKDLVVEDGEVKSFTDHPGGHDHRYEHGQDKPVACVGSWMYGCSLVAPVKAFLDTNGWPEWVDGMSFEDVLEGIALQKKGFMFVYDRTMMTFESEELHAQLPVMRRTDKGHSPNDKSHAALRMQQGGTGWNENYFGAWGIAGLRESVLKGEPFPQCGIPQHDWFDKQPINEMV